MYSLIPVTLLRHWKVHLYFDSDQHVSTQRTTECKMELQISWRS